MVSFLPSYCVLCPLQVGTESAAVQEASCEAKGSSGEESGGDDVWAAMETVGDEKLKGECVCMCTAHMHACVCVCPC